MRRRKIRIKGLREEHLLDLGRSGLSANTITAARLRSIDRASLTQILGFDPRCGGLIFPYFIGGETVLVRVKVDSPYQPFGRKKPAKYLTPRGATNRLYVPPNLSGECLTDASIPLIIAEGEKKALKAVQEGFPCVFYAGIAGVWSWKTKVNGMRRAIPDFDSINWSERRAYIAFDSDAVTNRNVMAAEESLASELRKRGANVGIIRIRIAEQQAQSGSG